MRKFRFLIALIVIFSSVIILTKPLILFFTKKLLAGAFRGSSVSIKACSLKPASLISFTDIEIKHGAAYEARIKEAKISYSIASLLRRCVLKADIQDAALKINLGKESAVNLIKRYLEESAKTKSIFLIKDIAISDFKVNLKSGDLNLSANATLSLDPIRQIINSMDLKVASLAYRGINLAEGTLNARQAEAKGGISIREIEYNKLKIKDIRGSAELKDKILLLNSLSGELLDGSAAGNLFVTLDEGASYNLKLNFSGLDLGRYIKDAELEKKLELAGKVSGSLVVQGRGPEFEVIAGNFNASGAGGRLVIKDDEFLKRLARNSEQSFNILLEGFKDYHYNVGAMGLSLDQGNLLWQVKMDGEKGKRELTIVVHDFKLGEEGL